MGVAERLRLRPARLILCWTNHRWQRQVVYKKIIVPSLKSTIISLQLVNSTSLGLCASGLWNNQREKEEKNWNKSSRFSLYPFIVLYYTSISPPPTSPTPRNLAVLVAQRAFQESPCGRRVHGSLNHLQLFSPLPSPSWKACQEVPKSSWN